VSEAQDKDAAAGRILEAAVRNLGEHFDTVQIHVTSHEGFDTKTLSLSSGCGNWFARVGQCREWLMRQDERTRQDIEKNE
jgi:hypothetical protein